MDVNFGVSCIVLFLVIFMVPILFAFAYHEVPILVLVVVGGLIVATLMILCVPHGAFLAATLLVTFVGATAGGLHIYYAYALPFRALREGRTYNNVYPAQPAIAYADAAVVRFAGNTTIDETKALGMTNLDVGIHKFCVAPIVDEKSTGRVEFWAVGMDCCGKLGNFECGDAGVSGVHGGVVLNDRARNDQLFTGVGRLLAPPWMRQDLFLSAVSHAEAVHGLASSKRPLLMTWSGKSRGQFVAQARASLTVALAVAGIPSLCLAVAISFILKGRDAFRKAHSAFEARAARTMGLPDDTPAEVTDFVSFHAGGTSRSTREVVLFGFGLPLLSGVVSTVLWTWLRCLKSGDVIASIFVGISFAVAATLLLVPRRRVYGLLILLTTAGGAYVGQWNHVHNMFHYCAVVNHRAYSDVPAGANSAEYSDAGMINFAYATSVNVSQTIGYLHRGKTYCAAPIIPGPRSDWPLSVNDGEYELPPRVPHVDFWAVGVDCCSARGNFQCGGGRSSLTGLVFRDAGVGDEQHKLFLRAVNAASDHYGLPQAKSPMLVLWGGDLDSLRQDGLGQAVGVCLMAAAGAILVLFVVSGFMVVFEQGERKEAEAFLRQGDVERFQQQRQFPEEF